MVVCRTGAMTGSAMMQWVMGQMYSVGRVVRRLRVDGDDAAIESDWRCVFAPLNNESHWEVVLW